jgi:hypothetical protein
VQKVAYKVIESSGHHSVCAKISAVNGCVAIRDSQGIETVLTRKYCMLSLVVVQPSS